MCRLLLSFQQEKTMKKTLNCFLACAVLAFPSLNAANADEATDKLVRALERLMDKGAVPAAPQAAISRKGLIEVTYNIAIDGLIPPTAQINCVVYISADSTIGYSSYIETASRHATRTAAKTAKCTVPVYYHWPAVSFAERVSISGDVVFGTSGTQLLDERAAQPLLNSRAAGFPIAEIAVPANDAVRRFTVATRL
jgi:hypothetical protein